MYCSSQISQQHHLYRNFIEYMRKSLAPSQRKSLGSGQQEHPGVPICETTSAEGDFVTIERMPMFGFLTIPNNLQKQFKVPSGCRITAKSIELRKVKSLGPKRNWVPLRPGDLSSSFRASVLEPCAGAEEDGDLEGLPNTESMPPFERLILWKNDSDPTHSIEVVPELACKLRPHQREGVQFLFECTMGLRGFVGQGCILADDMGLGKTLMSITTMWTLLNQGFVKGEPAVKKVVVACPTSLVGNWENEINRWLSGRCIIFAVKAEPKKVIKSFVQHRGKGVLIVSYETQRRYSDMFKPSAQLPQNTCDLLICDEAHKLKNAESGLAVSLNKLPARKRILLSGTPMQNELTEFFNMVNFCNPLVLGTSIEFRKAYERPILMAREPGASPNIIERAALLQRELSTIVNEFILKRGNILNAQHLPPKLVQYVCCRMTPLQEELYDTLLSSKVIRHIRDGIQKDALNSIRYLMHICCHPKMIVDGYKAKVRAQETDEELEQLVEIIQKAGGLGTKSSSGGVSSSGGSVGGGMMNRRGQLLGQSSSRDSSVDPDLSGKLTVLVRMLQTLRAMKEGDRIVIVSNYTSTLDIIESICQESKWPVLRLDGTTGGTKRTKLVAQFNEPGSGAFVFLLSSKAGGCGINLIGGNRLVLFDPDWNPASDKQAAGRIWREGQRKRCFIYRFMTTSSVEEKIIQRQLSKESLQSIVDDKDAVNIIPQNELKSLFTRRKDTRSDTHDTLRCKRCNSVRALSITTESSKNLSAEQVEECQEFLQDFINYVREAATGVMIVSTEEDGTTTRSGVESIEDLVSLHNDISKGVFNTLPSFSKKLRKVISCIQEELDAAQSSINISDEFLNRWADLVPMLSAAPPSVDSGRETADLTRGNADDDAGEFVPQEGCPDDEDFNRWSHHCSVNTCDDEALKRAVGDSDVVSFVFGLEVNWDLLQARQEQKREEEEARREQQRNELEALNQRRAMKAAADVAGPSSDVANLDSGVIAVVAATKGERRSDKKQRRRVLVDESDDDSDGGMSMSWPLVEEEEIKPSTKKTVIKESALLSQQAAQEPKKAAHSSSQKNISKTDWLRSLLDEHDLFPAADIVDAYEALLVCLFNFSTLDSSIWSRRALDSLEKVTLVLTREFEAFPWRKGETRICLRPLVTSFSISKIQKFKTTAQDTEVSLSSCIEMIYRSFTSTELPRQISSVLKAAKYIHKSLDVTRSNCGDDSVTLDSSFNTFISDDKENDTNRTCTVKRQKSCENELHQKKQRVAGVDSLSVSTPTVNAALSPPKVFIAAETIVRPWKCSRCTFESTPESLFCEMCFSKRPRL